MEYLITSERPFDEIEATSTGTLERHGFTVQRTFSLHSATGAAGAHRGPGYSVLMIFRAGAERPPVGLLTLYEQGGRTIIRAALTSPEGGDADAEVVAALLLDGLERCLDAAEGEDCAHSDHAAEGSGVPGSR